MQKAAFGRLFAFLAERGIPIDESRPDSA